MPCRAFFVPPRGEHRELGEHRGQGLNALSGILRFSTKLYGRVLVPEAIASQCPVGHSSFLHITALFEQSAGRPRLNALSGILRFSTRAHDRRLGRRRLVSMPCRAFFVSPLSVAELVSQWTACLNALSGILRFSTRAEEHDMSKLGQGVSQCPVG